MPIKGISDIRRLPRVGKIRLGERATSAKGSQYPRAVDYFVVREDDATSAAAVAAFRQVYGDRPRELRIMFPTNDEESFFPQWYKSYKAGVGLWCRGDGEVAQRVENGQLVEVPCPCDLLKQGLCKRIGNLQFLLPDVPIIGVWQLDTSSFHSMVNLNSTIEMIKGMTGGRIAGIPLTLRLRPQEVAPDGRKKTVYVLELALEGWTLPKLMQAAQRPAPALMAPPVDHNEIPEDLYPAPLVAAVKADASIGDDVAAPAEPEAAKDEPGPDNGPLMDRLRAAAAALGWTEARLQANVEAAQARGMSLEELAAKMEAKAATMTPTTTAPADTSRPTAAVAPSPNGNGNGRRRVF